MLQYEFDWTKKPFEHTEKSIENADHLAIKALGVAHKHFFDPQSEFDLAGWSKLDHYGHHCIELDDDYKGDDVRFRPWIVGQWSGGKECIFKFEPDEMMEETLKGVDRDRHRRGAIFGVYLTITRRDEGWSAVFAFRMEDKQDGDRLHDLPITEVLCLKISGDAGRVEEWLDWAYKEKA